jgi:hypothetical protein
MVANVDRAARLVSRTPPPAPCGSVTFFRKRKDKNKRIRQHQGGQFIFF